MPRTPENIRSLARAHSDLALRTIVGLCSAGKTEQVRLGAAIELLNRGWGRPQPDDADRDGITIVIRKILENGKVQPKPQPPSPDPLTIEHQANGNSEERRA
jgi:hypothetical protein